MGVGTDDDRRRDRPDPRGLLQAGGEVLGQGLQRGAVGGQLLGAGSDSDRQALGLCPGDHYVCLGVRHGPPGGDGSDLRVLQRPAGVDAEVDASQQRGEGIA
ncbi:hypothetical protein, partial [Kocuria rhizosphaericola]|uniref:hypothetical protein n=1 Tax=Kocuria rhizosphaericola TaxID=3376284 RepID=UPI00378BB931